MPKWYEIVKRLETPALVTHLSLIQKNRANVFNVFIFEKINCIVKFFN